MFCQSNLDWNKCVFFWKIQIFSNLPFYLKLPQKTKKQALCHNLTMLVHFTIAFLKEKKISHLAGMSPYISLKKKKRHYEHHMIEANKYLITWISDDIFFLNSG
jgi:hypothetical protein